MRGTHFGYVAFSFFTTDATIAVSFPFPSLMACKNQEKTLHIKKREPLNAKHTHTHPHSSHGAIMVCFLIIKSLVLLDPRASFAIRCISSGEKTYWLSYPIPINTASKNAPTASTRDASISSQQGFIRNRGFDKIRQNRYAQ